MEWKQTSEESNPNTGGAISLSAAALLAEWKTFKEVAPIYRVPRGYSDLSPYRGGGGELWWKTQVTTSACVDASPPRI